MDEPKRIVVVKLSDIGDVLTAAPAEGFARVADALVTHSLASMRELL